VTGNLNHSKIKKRAYHVAYWLVFILLKINRPLEIKIKSGATLCNACLHSGLESTCRNTGIE